MQWLTQNEWLTQAGPAVAWTIAWASVLFVLVAGLV